MASLDQLQRALVNADKVGNVEDARALAGAIQRMRGLTPAVPVQPPASFGQTAADVGKQLLSAVPREAANLAGMPGDLFKGTVRTLDAAKNYFGGGDHPTDMTSDLIGSFVDNYMTSDSIKRNASNTTGVTLPQPETQAGAYASEFGQAGLGAAALSPWRGFLSAAKNGLKFGTLPVAAGEAVGAGLEKAGTPKGYADAARLGVSMFGGGVASLKPSMFAKSSEKLKTIGLDLLARAKQEGVVISPAAQMRLYTDMEEALRAAGGGGNTGKEANKITSAFMMDVMDQATSGHPLTLEGLETFRQNLARASSGQMSDPAMASILRRKIDSFIADLPNDPTNVLGGDPQRVSALLKDYRAHYTLAKTGERLNDLIDRATLSASWAQGDKSTALRNEFRTLARDADEMKMFPPEVQQAIRDATQVSTFEKAMTYLGKYSPMASLRTTAVGSGVAAGGAYALGAGNPTIAAIAAMVPVAGEGGRLAANQIAKRDAAIASTLGRGGRVTPSPSMGPLTGVYVDALLNKYAVPPRGK